MLPLTRDGSLRLLAALSFGLVLSACSGGRVVEQGSRSDLKQVPSTAWERLGQMRVLFGHQSVGFNIIDGMKDVMKDNPVVKLKIVEVQAPPAPPGPAFAHFRVGENTKPDLKTDDFARWMNGAGDDAPDIAFFKFCYVDANPRTDVQAVFGHYKRVLSDLRARHPQTAFIHVTMPLTRIQTGWKVPIKELIGRPIDGVADNIARNEFNDLMRAEYGGKEPIFDLAAIESTLPDASRMSVRQGDRVYAMVPAYTTDGGHLNEVGRRIAAEQLLVLLAGLAAGRK
jgi:hypothetical protein